MKKYAFILILFFNLPLFSQILPSGENTQLAIEAPSLVDVATSATAAEFAFIQGHIKKDAENLDTIKNVLIDCEVKKIRVTEKYQGKTVPLAFNIWFVKLEKERRLKKLLTSVEFKEYSNYTKKSNQ